MRDGREWQQAPGGKWREDADENLESTVSIYSERTTKASRWDR